MGEPVENGIEEHPQENGVDQRPPEEPVKPEKVVKKIRVTYEEYRTIANLLILHLRQIEESSEGGSCDLICASCDSHMTFLR